MDYKTTWPDTERLLVEIQFRFVPYLLNMIRLKLWFIYFITYVYEFWYNFDTVLYQVLETGTADRTNIGRDQLLTFLGLYTPFHFSLTDPLKNNPKWYANYSKEFQKAQDGALKYKVLIFDEKIWSFAIYNFSIKKFKIFNPNFI